MTQIGIDKRIRANLIRLRLAKGLEQNALAELSGVSHIAQLESGARGAGKKVLLKLALALHVDYAEFYKPVERMSDVENNALNILVELYNACSPIGKRLIEEMVFAVVRYETKHNDP